MNFSFGRACWAAALLVGAASCSSKPDSVEQAQQANEAKMETTKSDTTVTTSQGTAGPTSKAYDSDFMTKAASGGMLEVQLGQALVKRAVTPEAKQFAQEMVTDHTKNNAELKALAAQKNITLPTVLGKDQQQVYDDVLAEKGPTLDQKYIKAMVADHEEDLKDYQGAVAKATDSQVRDFAQRTIPVLQMHLTMGQKIQPVVDARK